ncbi:MAG TPA: hypothetical protein EYQ00_14690 [Dehalococcoidia bacterium]|nr:hypothetical protein [Dehalococcoidia bacterium]
MTTNIFLDTDVAVLLPSLEMSGVKTHAFPLAATDLSNLADRSVLTVPYLFSLVGPYSEQVIEDGLSRLLHRLNWSVNSAVWVRCLEGQMPPNLRNEMGTDVLQNAVEDFFTKRETDLHIVGGSNGAAPSIAASWQASSVAERVAKGETGAEAAFAVESEKKAPSCCSRILCLFESASLPERHGYGTFRHHRFIGHFIDQEIRMLTPDKERSSRSSLLQELRDLVAFEIQKSHSGEAVHLTIMHSGSDQASEALAHSVNKTVDSAQLKITVTPMTLRSATLYGPDAIVVGWKCFST